MKLSLTIAMLTVCLSSFGQDNMLLVTIPVNNEFDFHKVESTRRNITGSEVENFEILDTIAKDYILNLKSSGIISIEIKKEDDYMVYKLLNKDEKSQKISKQI